MIMEVPFEKLRRICDPNLVSCETTKELVPSKEIIGQERAVRALKFGLNIKERGFNVYVAGYPGTGRTTAVKNFLDDLAKSKPVPSDWCYVNNFNDTYEPKALKLPAGKGAELQKDIKSFIDEARRALPKAFESEDFLAKREATVKSIEDERRKLLSQLDRRAQEAGFVLQSTTIGIITVPVINGRPVSEEEFMSLSPRVKDEIEKRRDILNSDMRTAMWQLGDLGRKASDELEKLNKEVALYTIGHLIGDMIDKYKELPNVTSYIENVRNDILDNLDQFIREPETQAQLPFQVPWMREAPFRKYEVNVIVDNSDLKGAPVIIEHNPTYQYLFGRIEKEAQFGALTTDFTMIHSGSIHKANGGYIVLPVEDLLRNPLSYEALKRCMIDGSIGIEEPGERLGFVTSKSLRPSPILLDIKVVLIGNPLFYNALYSEDSDFRELFKVKADFNTTMDRTEDNMQKYAAFICTLCEKESLKHLDSSGVAKMIEYGSRLAADQQKLSTAFSEIADVIREANFYAMQDNEEYISANHVKKAIEEEVYRSNLIQEELQEMIERDILIIDTDGAKVGQVNGLSVMGLGDFSFGVPSRVTISLGLGQEGIIDIQREAKLAGPIHTKGVMILGGYLAEKYAQDKPLSLSARLVFEQSYGMVEGDSASSTELYAILSALSGIPIKQSFAVTGSVNQKGEVQAIGGVNEKIEGYFEVCKAKGLNGKQSVLIPDSNIQNLMLKEEVVDTVKAGQFHIYSVKTIEQGIEILTGKNIGERQSDGTFQEGTINYLVNKRLREMAETLSKFNFSSSEGKKVDAEE